MRKPKRPTAKLKRLPKSNNGTHRSAAAFGLYQYQKEELDDCLLDKVNTFDYAWFHWRK